jgi:8-oxo-dGTP pyrophosphatase MutT (NUDIX family)
MTSATNSPDVSVILAAGGVLCRQTSAGGDEILVVHRKRYGDWTLPKGKLKPGESFAAAALREVAEETGCKARFEDYLGAIGYAVKGVPKAVLFWRMSLIEQHEIADHEEVAEVLWMPAKAAIQRLTHPDERTVALRASEGASNV